ncbi:permease-like cell division protein FtsX [Yinghuangia seranimata]|uniref:permease-like cell division protein FtsX n=1 Tax=Yinghuangia seranimata TaxID=408067 RepID=UPI00248B9DCA|nr:permease-like cell division protein FtsX [Yinghuangia seranimata]MDI2127645.1 permease-like cell division protein FtsX [Yinghuangia seranimata]
MPLSNAVRARAAELLCLPLLSGAMLVVAGCSDSGSGGNTRNGAATSAAPGPAGTSSAGGASATPSRADYWAGKADVALFLCNKFDPTRDGCANGPVTDAEREAVRQDLQRMPEVEKVYYENQAEAFEHFKAAEKDSALAAAVTVDQMPESFRVKLRDPRSADVVTTAFRGRAGVQSVIVRR